MPFRASRSSSSCSERALLASARAARASASSLLGGDGLFLRFGLDVVGRRRIAVHGRARRHLEPRRHDLVGADLGLELAEDALGEIRVLAQERGRVLAALAEAL